MKGTEDTESNECVLSMSENDHVEAEARRPGICIEDPIRFVRRIFGNSSLARPGSAPTDRTKSV